MIEYKKQNILASVRVGSALSTNELDPKDVGASDKPMEDQSGLMAAGGLIAVVAIVFLVPTGMFLAKAI